MKTILDVDTGIDDALAIAYALGRPEIELIGLTTLYGNVTIDRAVANSLNILALLGRTDLPVFEGAHHPLNATSYSSAHLHQVHGVNGIGEVILPTSPRVKEALSAVDFIIKSASQYKEELTLIATGPLTNLALAWQKNPQAIKQIGKIVVMGSAVTVQGNVTPFAEANIYNDPEAAKLIFEAGLNLTLVGLDVTLQTMLTEKEIATWTTVDSDASRALVAMSTYYYQNEYAEEKNIGGALHDPLAIEVALNPDVVTASLAINLTVETEGISRGRTIGDLNGIHQKQKNLKLALTVKADEFIEKFSTTILNVIE